MGAWRGLACAGNNLPVFMIINYAFGFQKAQLHNNHAVAFPKKEEKGFFNYIFLLGI